MQISGATKKQHDSPRLNRHAAFLFIIFSGCLYRMHKLTSHFLHRPAKYCRRAAKLAKSVIFFEGYLPFVGWLQAARFPYSDALHIFPQNTPRYLFYVFCMQDAVPARPKQACISVDKYNMQDFFWNVLFFLRNFFVFLRIIAVKIQHIIYSLYI